MKNLTLAFIFWVYLSSMIFAQNSELNIIPQPKSVQKLKGEFNFNLKTKIVATDETGRKSAGILNDLLLKSYGFKLESTNKQQKENAIIFISKGFPVDKMPKEDYGLNVTPKGVLVYGNETGQFYAIQTLMQILPLEMKGEAKIPAVDIADEPRFKYRGMHLDVSRHFMPVSFVKKFIELMSQYKFNQFH